jgi:hypothetical protein
MPQLFHGSRLKIERANEHIDNLKTRIALLHKTDTARVDIDPKTGGEFLEHSFSDIKAFDDIALMVGDALHNLKCALDYVWLETIQQLVPTLVDDRAKFPVRKTIEEVKGWLAKAEVRISCPSLYSFLLDIVKPCDGGNVAIWTIHNFSNRDKHRLIIPVLAAGNIEGIEVEDEKGERFVGSGVGDFQKPPYYILFQKGLHVKIKGKLTAHVGVQDGKSGCFMHVPETLVHYSRIISGVIEVFERFLETELSR